MTSFGKGIRRIRMENGWTLEKMAAKLNTSKQNLSRYEHEEREPKLSTAVDFAKKLGVSIEELIK